MKRESDKTAHVNSNDEISLLCQECGNFLMVDASPYKVMPSELDVTCDKCGHTFTLSLNFRNFYRKETNLSGICAIVDTPWPGDTIDFENCTGIIVENLSRTGIGFKLKSPLSLFAGDILLVKFTLDNTKRSSVTKTVIVRRITDDYIGAEFFPYIDERDKDLAFYIML